MWHLIMSGHARIYCVCNFKYLGAWRFGVSVLVISFVPYIYSYKNAVKYICGFAQ